MQSYAVICIDHDDQQGDRENYSDAEDRSLVYCMYTNPSVVYVWMMTGNTGNRAFIILLESISPPPRMMSAPLYCVVYRLSNDLALLLFFLH